jgi:hypothetical protein
MRLRTHQPVRVGACWPHARIVRVLSVRDGVVTITDQVTWLPERVAIEDIRPLGHPLPVGDERAVDKRVERSLPAAARGGVRFADEPSRSRPSIPRSSRMVDPSTRPAGEPVRPLVALAGGRS